MRTLKYDVVVIGGGPAGLAAALKAREKVEKVAVLERNFKSVYPQWIWTPCI